MEPDIIEEYLLHLQSKGYSKETINGYRYTLNGFAAFLAAACECHSLFSVKEEHIFLWCDTCLTVAVLKNKTVRHNYSIIYGFYEWLYTTGRLLLNPIPKTSFRGIRVLPRRVPHDSVVRRAYTVLHGSKYLADQRDYALIELAYGCGLRRCELHRLDVEDVRIEERTIKVKGKGRKERMIPVGEHTLRAVLYYLFYVRPRILKHGGRTNALFVTWHKGGSRIERSTISKAFWRLRRKYGLEKTFCAHGLRHAFATDLVRNGAPVQDVSAMLGHKEVATTRIYTHLVPRDLKEHHKKFHPRA